MIVVKVLFQGISVARKLEKENVAIAGDLNGHVGSNTEDHVDKHGGYS